MSTRSTGLQRRFGEIKHVTNPIRICVYATPMKHMKDLVAAFFASSTHFHLHTPTMKHMKDLVAMFFASSCDNTPIALRRQIM